jgi:ABC-type phosphonate transport system ATPase subunit
MSEMPARQQVPPDRVLRVLDVPQARFKRLRRLGLLGPAPDGNYALDELRREYDAICELEQRVAAIGERLTVAERNGALAWLAEIARTSLTVADQPVVTANRIDELLDVLERRFRGH